MGFCSVSWTKVAFWRCATPSPPFGWTASRSRSLSGFPPLIAVRCVWCWGLTSPSRYISKWRLVCRAFTPKSDERHKKRPRSKEVNGKLSCCTNKRNLFIELTAWNWIGVKLKKSAVLSQPSRYHERKNKRRPEAELGEDFPDVCRRVRRSLEAAVRPPVCFCETEIQTFSILALFLAHLSSPLPLTCFASLSGLLLCVFTVWAIYRFTALVPAWSENNWKEVEGRTSVTPTEQIVLCPSSLTLQTLGNNTGRKEREGENSKNKKKKGRMRGRRKR